jgi:hypothetical protein
MASQSGDALLVVYPSRKHLPKKVSVAIKFFKTYLGEPAYWDKALVSQIKI